MANVPQLGRSKPCSGVLSIGALSSAFLAVLKASGFAFFQRSWVFGDCRFQWRDVPIVRAAIDHRCVALMEGNNDLPSV
tara:strand:+ start:123 stop:359 length:237 start_codon:yes stop_codon:yes gene_type:complete